MKELNSQDLSEFDNFGSIYVYNFTDVFIIFLHKIPYMSPNVITTARNLLLIHLYYKIVYKNDFNNAGVYVFLIGLLDCVDGEYARKYKMASKFGDKYDHISDAVTTIVLFYLLFKYSGTKFNLIVAALFLFTNTQHIMCSEIYRKKHLNINTSRDSISMFNKLCPVKTKSGLENFLRRYKYLGYCTYYIVLAILFAKMKKYN